MARSSAAIAYIPVSQDDIAKKLTPEETLERLELEELQRKLQAGKILAEPLTAGEHLADAKGDGIELRHHNAEETRALEEYNQKYKNLLEKFNKKIDEKRTEDAEIAKNTWKGSFLSFYRKTGAFFVGMRDHVLRVADLGGTLAFVLAIIFLKIPAIMIGLGVALPPAVLALLAGAAGFLSTLLIGTAVAFIGISIAIALNIHRIYSDPELKQREIRYAMSFLALGTTVFIAAISLGAIAAAPPFTIPAAIFVLIASGYIEDRVILRATQKEIVAEEAAIKREEAELQTEISKHKKPGVTYHSIKADLEADLKIRRLAISIHDRRTNLETLNISVAQANKRQNIRVYGEFVATALLLFGAIALVAFPPVGALAAAAAILAMVGAAAIMALVTYNNWQRYSQGEENKKRQTRLKTTCSKDKENDLIRNHYENAPQPLNSPAMIGRALASAVPSLSLPPAASATATASAGAVVSDAKENQGMTCSEMLADANATAAAAAAAKAEAVPGSTTPPVAVTFLSGSSVGGLSGETDPLLDRDADSPFNAKP